MFPHTFLSEISKVGDYMNFNKLQMWETNIENAASSVAAEYGSAVVNSIFARYDATGLHNLASCYYSEVFADLEQIANDN